MTITVGRSDNLDIAVLLHNLHIGRQNSRQSTFRPFDSQCHYIVTICIYSNPGRHGNREFSNSRHV